MSTQPDPGWLRAAQSVYSACLWLYPKQLRDAHGDEMCQGFRDRCREAVRGERSVFRVLALELAPDTLRSIGSAQISATFDEMRPRQFWALGLLCFALVGLLFRDNLSRFTLDLAFQAKYAWQRASAERELSQHEARMRELATFLLSVDGSENKALAAYLYRSAYLSRTTQWEFDKYDLAGPMPADGDRATALASDVLGAHASAYALAVAVRSCDPAVGCNRGEAIGQLTAREPDNGYGWALAFTWAAQRHDDAAMRHAVQQLAQSSQFENYQGAMTRDLLKQAQALAPGDIDYLQSIASLARVTSFGTFQDYRNDLLVSCSRRPVSDTKSTPIWLETHPEMQADCLRIAQILSNSTDVRAARWGSRRVYEAQSEPSARGLALQNLRDRWWWQQNAWNIGVNLHTQDHGWEPWSEAEWQNWANAWAPGDGEIPSVKRWLKSRGLSVSAPPEFELPSW